MPARDLTLDEIRSAMPDSGLFEGKDWLLSPRPLPLSKKQAKSMESLGHSLVMFQKACDRIYRASRAGKAPAWIARLIDTGKPEWMTQLASESSLAEVTPRVVRPDLILTEEGWAIAEIDSVPGGVGLTAWLSDLYAGGSWDLLGGAKGMDEGFAQVLPENGKVLISKESADYRPEMEWMADRLGGGRVVLDAETYSPSEGDDLYRFFENFDWQEVEPMRGILEAHARGKLEVTPPIKPHLEEKMWLALLWAPALAGLWKKELRGSHLKKLQKVVPYGWAIDNAELPPIATLPRLDAHSWDNVAEFSQKERELVLKISGFSELGWGSRGVHIGHDMAAEDWRAVVKQAVSEVGTQGWMMQEFHNGAVIEHPYYDPESGITRIMEGRVRVCPYFFINDAGRTELGGCLATIVPKDKKKIHGMKDGILVPCVIGDDA